MLERKNRGENMTSWDFLDWGLDINKADTDVRIEGLITQLEKEPQDDDRDFLMRGAMRRRDGIANLHTPQSRQRLEAPARKWCALDKPRREMYLSILRGVKSWDALGENHKKIDALHQSVIALAGSDDPHELIKAMLRLQEATAQFLSTPHAPQRLMSKWKEVGTLQTIWGPWEEAPKPQEAETGTEATAETPAPEPATAE
jgi:hypothetical protein